MKHRLLRLSLSLLALLFFVMSTAQECYEPFLKEGIKSFEALDFEAAITQFKAAKICDDIPANNEIDNWISKAQSGFIDVIKKEKTTARVAALSAKSLLALLANKEPNRAYLLAKYAYQLEDNNESRSALYQSVFQLDSDRKKLFYTKKIKLDFNSFFQDYTNSEDKLFALPYFQSDLSIIDTAGNILGTYKNYSQYYDRRHFAPDNKSFITYSEYDEVICYKMPEKGITHPQLFSVKRQNTRPSIAQFFPYTKWGPILEYLVVGYNDGYIEVYDAKGKKLVEWKAHEEAVAYLALENIQGRILSAGTNKDLKLWSFETTTNNVQELFQTKFNGFTKGLRPQFVENGEHILFTKSLDSIVLIDNKGKILAAEKNEYLFDTGFRKASSYPDTYVALGRFLYQRYFETPLKSNYKLIKTFPPAERHIYFSPISSNTIVTDDLSDFYLRDNRNSDWEAVATFGKNGVDQIQDFSPEGKHVMTFNNAGDIKLWNLNLGITEERPFSGELLNIVKANGKNILIRLKETTLYFSDLEVGSMLDSLSLDNKKIVASHEMGNKLILHLVKGKRNTVLEIDCSKKQFKPLDLYSFDLDFEIELQAMTDNLIAVYTKDANSFKNNLIVFDYQEKKQFKLNEDLLLISALSISPDGNHLMLGDFDGKISHFKIDRLQREVKMLNKWKSHDEPVNFIKISDDGQIYSCVLGRSGQTMKIWNFDAEQIGAIDFQEEINNLIWSSKGAYFFGLKGTNAISVWDSEGVFLTDLNLDFFTDCSFLISPDDKYLLSKKEFEDHIKIWPISPDLIIQKMDKFSIPDLSIQDKKRLGIAN